MTDSLTRLKTMVDQLLEATDEVKRLNDALAEAKRSKLALEQEDLPELMRELGFDSVTVDGRVVTVVEDLSCSITQANSSRALEWLTNNGFGGLIKTKLEVAFNRDEYELAQTVADSLVGLGQEMGMDFIPALQETVHPATLKSFIKEELEKGRAVPFDLFSVHPYNRVKITKR